uniref:Reverse transcriptase domain-containing protein n=1 Tax=Oryzias sinensis TaxID=183150 RepID=A0A8C7Y9D2_9TELE
VSTGTPQGCCLSPKLFSLYTHDCTSPDSNIIIIKYADDTTVLGLIREGDESAYRDLVHSITIYGEDNDLVLNVEKTKEVILDYRRKAPPHQPLIINGTVVERTDCHRFLGLQITNSLSWKKNTVATVKKAQQRLYFIRMLKNAGLKRRTLTQAYRGLVESILTSGLTAWFGNTTIKEKKMLQRVINTAGKIIGCNLPSMDTIYEQRCRRRVTKIIRDRHHPAPGLIQCVDSGHNLRRRRPESIHAHTTRFHNSFFPTAIRMLAKDIREGRLD